MYQKGDYTVRKAFQKVLWWLICRCLHAKKDLIQLHAEILPPLHPGWVMHQA